MKKMLLILLLLSFPISSYANDKPLLTVLDFIGSNVSEQERQVLVDFISSHVVSSGKYRVIDRMQRDAILKEIEFSYSGCTDESCQLEVGKLLQAEQIIVGSLGKVGSLFILNMKLIEVETGETVHTGSKEYDSMDELIKDSRAMTLAFIEGEAPVKFPETEKVSVKPEVFENRIEAVKRANEKQEKLEKLLSEFIYSDFQVWMNENGYEILYAEGSLDEKVEIAQEFYNSSRTIWSFDLGIYSRLITFDSPSSYSYPPSIGLSFDVFYHLNNSFGIGLGLSPGLYTEIYETTDRRINTFIPFDINLNLVTGDKKDLSYSYGIFCNVPFGLFFYQEYWEYNLAEMHIGASFGVYYRKIFIRIKAAFLGVGYLNADIGPAIILNTGYSLLSE